MAAQISCTELAQMLTNGQPVYLVDVRQPWEHETAALPDSVLIPLDQLGDRLSELAPPEGALVVTYCHHGVRSLTAAAVIAQQAGLRVASLRGGIEAWSVTIDPRIPRY